MIWSLTADGGRFAGALGGTRTRYPICTTGVMTMKMMSRTSTTSTSGVTLMSDRIEPPPPTCIDLDSWLRCSLRLRDQTDVVEADLAAGLEDVEHRAVFHQLVALDRDLAVGGALMDGFQLRLHLLLADDGRTEIDAAVRLDRDLQLLVGVRRPLRLLGHRQVDRHAFLQHGRDDHEDDQQHQADVDQRSHVDLRVHRRLLELADGAMPPMSYHARPLPS